MSGLGGLNKSPNGVVFGLVQLQLPVVATSADLALQTEKICAMVAKARRNAPSLDLVVFPEYALHGLSMDTSAEIMCRLDGPEVAAFKRACSEKSISPGRVEVCWRGGWRAACPRSLSDLFRVCASLALGCSARRKARRCVIHNQRFATPQCAQSEARPAGCGQKGASAAALSPTLSRLRERGRSFLLPLGEG
jgi:hypothetical protein